MSDNNLTLVGNMTRDPELRFTTGGRAHAAFGLAVNRRYQQNNEWVEQVSFFNVICWGTLAENAAASLNKGMRVLVSGRLEQRRYDDAEGNKKSVVEVIADDLGPSMRWARAEVEKISRDASAGGQAPSSGAGRPSDPVYGDEEPF